ncbi:UNVERIFIED_CONTAM: hypothetical protein FKN15_056233 [Acipenser sinensis]
MLVSDQLKPGLEALCWAGEDGRDDSSCRVHAVGGSALEPELTLSKKESWTSLGVVLFFVVLKPCPTALLWTRARARRRVGSWDHLSLQFHSLFGFFSPTREGPCGPVLHRCSGTAVPPHQMADDFERGGPSFPPGEGAADLSERGREARVPFPQRSGSSLGGPAGVGNPLNPMRARDRGLKFFPMNEEFPVSAGHKLALIKSLPFVHTARRYYRLDGLVRSSDRPRRGRLRPWRSAEKTIKLDYLISLC